MKKKEQKPIDKKVDEKKPKNFDERRIPGYSVKTEVRVTQKARIGSL